MTPNFRHLSLPGRSAAWLAILSGLYLTLSWPTPLTFAQHPGAPASGGTPQALPRLPQKPPRPVEGPESVSAFIDGLSANDAAFEVIVGQGRILATKEDIAVAGKAPPVIALGDPNIVEFAIVSPRQLRVIGLRIGVTDLSITTWDNRTYSFEVHVVADLNALRGQLYALYPGTHLKLAQIREYIVVEGQARDQVQVARILDTVRAYLTSVQESQARRGAGPPARPGGGPGAGAAPGQPPARLENGPRSEESVQQLPSPPGQATGYAPRPAAATPTGNGATAIPQVINLLRVPGPQQVLLKVRVAELNRTAMREIGADFLGVDPDTGAIIGTQIGGATISAIGRVTGAGVIGNASGQANLSTTVFGIFENGDFEFFLRALRRNSMLKILAEPNLVAMNGHQASFLAGGEFPIPVPQTVTGGVGSTVTVIFKEFGVRLGFLPFILDGDVIRLSVDPEVSSIDFALGTTLVPGGSPVPGLNTRRAHTTVELRQGQTLAIAGLLQLTLDGRTNRIPGMGDLPIIGPFFSNTSGTRIEKELVVLVTPYLVEAMSPDQVPPLPGDEVNEPNDLELYLMNRIEGRTGRDFRSTTAWDDPLHLHQRRKLERNHVRGPHGFSDQ
jgi:pilus assembly protein CpaC